MPQLDQRYLFSQFIICVITLFITYIIVNREYFKKYLIILNNRNKFINFYIKTIIVISEDINSELTKINQERIILFEKIKNKIQAFRKKKYMIKISQYNNIKKNINMLELIQQESNNEIKNMLNKIYNKYYITIKKYIILFLSSKK